MRHTLLYILISAIALAASAQDLATEIYVDRTVLPEQRAAQRPSLLPSLLNFATTETQLQAAEYQESGSITNMLRGLTPAPWKAAIEKTPYRGYIAAGYFPSFNLGASMGYKLIDTKQASLSVWGQYDGNQYTRDDVKLRNHFANLRAQGYYWVDNNSRISGELGYDFASVLHPYDTYNPYSRFTQRTNDIRALIGWNSDYEAIAFDFSFGYQYIKFNSWAPYAEGELPYVSTFNLYAPDVRMTSPQPHQSVVELKGGIGLTQEHSSTEIRYRWIGVDFDAQWASANIMQGALGEIHLDPYFRFCVGDLQARLGAKFSIATGDFDTGLRVAPNVRVDFCPESTPVAVWGEAGGGEALNTYSRLCMLDPYFEPAQQLGRTNMPISLGAGVNIGPISGFSLSLYGRLAAVRNWYAPMTNTYDFAIDAEGNTLSMWAYHDQPTFYGLDANTWLCGASIGYAYKSYLEFKCSGEKAGSNKSYATWYEWMDRADTQVKASMRVTPISPLDISVGYDWRGTRRGYYYNWEVYDIMDLHNLWVGASYRITDELTVWGRAENLTNSNYRLISGYAAQGTHGLIGLSLKF